MNATLATDLPLTSYNTQTTVPLGYIDPFNEDIYDSANIAMQPVGIGADGTQLWIIVHNGVDSHAIHFHLMTYSSSIVMVGMEPIASHSRMNWDGKTPFA